MEVALLSLRLFAFALTGSMVKMAGVDALLSLKGGTRAGETIVGQSKVGRPGLTPSEFADWYVNSGKAASNLYVVGDVGRNWDWDKFVATQRPSENVITGPNEPPMPEAERKAGLNRWIDENPGWSFLREPVRKNPAHAKKLMKEVSAISTDPFRKR